MFRFGVLVLLFAAATVEAQMDTFSCPENSSKTCIFVRNSTDCSVFYSCYLKAKPIRFNCPETLVFSESACTCVDVKSQYNDCAVPVLGGLFDDVLCIPRPNGTNVDPTDCHRFIQCYEDNSFVSMQCPPGLAYNFELNQCISETLVPRC